MLVFGLLKGYTHPHILGDIGVNYDDVSQLKSFILLGRSLHWKGSRFHFFLGIQGSPIGCDDIHINFFWM